MADDKLYVANGVERFEDRIDFALNLTKLKDLKEYFYDLNDSKYINLKICKKKISPDKWGKTHYVKFNDYKPEEQEEEVFVDDDTNDIGF